MLGTFELTVDGAPVRHWRGQKGLSLLKYLLAHGDRPCPRDLLMDVFWPTVAPEQARNRLHVALSGVRHTLRTATDSPLIVLSGGGYRLSPDVDLVVDVQQFQDLVDASRRAQTNGDPDAALDLCERAIALYQGEFLADTPYEEWAVLTRESLRSTYLDTLDRMTGLYVTRDQTQDCVRAARLILREDPCREDAHQVLMQCYVRQNRVNQALRQYELCRSALRATLGTSPSAATVRLVEALRQGAAADRGLDHHHAATVLRADGHRS
jgi:DNA-binding SARP family transcriptional activator